MASNKPGLPLRRLGRNGPMVPAMGFGLMGLSAFYSPTIAQRATPATTSDARFAILDRALELGETFWDTSDAYGDNEDLLGAWFRRTGNRDKVFLATKFGIRLDEDGKFLEVRGDREYVLAACERSLERLGTSWIDLYYVHRIDSRVPIEETVSALASLVRAGKIRYIGLSEASASTLRRAASVHPIAAHQIEYSPFTLDIESPSTPLLATARELGIATVAYSPLGRGFLTGAIKSPADIPADDLRHRVPRFYPENFGRNLEVVRTIGGVAERKRCSVAQLALAWVLAQGEDVLPIPGTTRVGALVENLGALEVRLAREEVEEVRNVVDRAVVGERNFPQHLLIAFGDSAPLEK